MFDLERELAAIRDALHAARIDYALCGGMAVALHGFPRATVDIDLLIRRSDEEEVYGAVGPLGYTVKAKPKTFDPANTEIRRVSKIDPGDGEVLMLDLLLFTAANEAVWDTRQRFQWNGNDLWVVSRQGLVALKRSRSSAIDLADIERLSQEP
jgi:hypothetical protein